MFVEAEAARDRAKRLLREDSPDRFSLASWQWLQLVVSPRWRQRNGRFLHKRPPASEKRGVLYHLRGIPPAALARPPWRRPGSRHHLMLPAPRQGCYESADLGALTRLPRCNARSPPSGHL